MKNILLYWSLLSAVMPAVWRGLKVAKTEIVETIAAVKEAMADRQITADEVDHIAGHLAGAVDGIGSSASEGA